MNSQSIVKYIPVFLLSLYARLRIGLPTMRVRLIAPLRLLGIGSKIWGPPKAQKTILDLVKEEKLELYQQDVEKWTLRFPAFLDVRLEARFSRHGCHLCQTTSVGIIYDGRVLSPDGAIVTSEDYVVEEYSRRIGRRRLPHPMLGCFRLPRCSYFGGTLAVLQVDQTNNYYHWVLEVLPRLGILMKSGLNWDRIFVSTPNSYQKDSIAMAGISSALLLDPVVQPHVEADCLLVPSRELNGKPSPSAVRFLRGLFVGGKSGTKNRYIYISRQKSSRRRVLNNLEVESLLNLMGFQTVYCENLSFAAQVDLFSDASVIVAPHGAGLTNIAFCAPGAYIVEFFSPDYVNLCYWALSHACGHYYWCLVGEGGPKNFPLEQGPHGRSDIRINLPELSALLKIVLRGPVGLR